MKKLLFILMLGSLFAQDELILLNGESIKGQYVKTEGNKIYFIPEGTLAVQSINQDMVQNLIQSEGDSPKEYHPSTNKLISSGNNLVEFRKQYYNGFILVLVGQLAIGYGAVANENDALLGGYLFSFIGSIAQLLSFNYVGEAGEDLIDQGVELDKQTK